MEMESAVIMDSVLAKMDSRVLIALSKFRLLLPPTINK